MLNLATLLIGASILGACSAQVPAGFFNIPDDAAFYRGRGLTSVNPFCTPAGPSGDDMGYVLDDEGYVTVVYCGTASAFPQEPGLRICPTPATDSGTRTILKIELVSTGPHGPNRFNTACGTIPCSGDTCSLDHPVPSLDIRLYFQTLADCDAGELLVLRTDFSVDPPEVGSPCVLPEDVDPVTDQIITTTIPNAIPAAERGTGVGNGIDAIATFACVSGYVKSSNGQSCVLAPTAGPNGRRARRAQNNKHASHSSNLARRTRTQKAAVEFDAFQ